MKIEQEGDYFLFSYQFILEVFENIKLWDLFINWFTEAETIAIKVYIKDTSNTKMLSEHTYEGRPVELRQTSGLK